MLEYSSNRFGNKWRKVDIHSVLIGDRLANDLTQWELAAELKKMKLPRLTENGQSRDDFSFRDSPARNA